MAEIDLFQAALGLPEPWRVVGAEFSADRKRLDLYLDFPKGSRFACPQGDAAACAVHDTSDKTWRHLDFFQHQAYLHARVPRVSCPTHGVRQVRLAWARPESGFTLLFEALLMALLAEMPVRAVAELVGEHDTRLWRLLHHHVDQARAEVSMAEVTRVGVDETSAKRGQDYVSLFVDLDAPKPRVLFATEGRDHSTVARFATDLVAHGGDPVGVRDVSADMSQAFERGVRASLPKAYLERWYEGAVRSRLQPIIDFAHMIGEHWEGVLRWHWTKINNGVLEGINSLVQASKRRARGYRNKRNLIAMIYLIAGRLDFSPTHTN